MKIREWLQANDLVLMHPGHGHNEGDMPVFPKTMDRLEAEYEVIRKRENE